MYQKNHFIGIGWNVRSTRFFNPLTFFAKHLIQHLWTFSSEKGYAAVVNFRFLLANGEVNLVCGRRSYVFLISLIQYTLILILS